MGRPLHSGDQLPYYLNGLTGISDKTLEMHFKLYEGYVKETNRLNQRIQVFFADGKVDQEEMPEYLELTRRIQRDGFA